MTPPECTCPPMWPLVHVGTHHPKCPLRSLLTPNVPAPALVEAYLRRTGWTEPQPRSATIATFCRGVFWLDVPVYAEYFAYTARFHEMLTKLADFEARSPAAVLADIRVSAA